jgi:hypothetical protein
MFCCALGTVILAALAPALTLWRKRLRGLFTGWGRARTALACLFVIGLALAGLLLVTEHFGHALALADGGIEDAPWCSATNAKE